ncbi:Hypothetical predicted protein [Podarcis lilfordi]|uniref:Uncharacterized protein n=1 Tax=Podarcis lilfordi TaxID=74358 RepID=A0AA35KM28_9SAUR|nr:Hypothetical predicted protein [Podarcis lilfordi]
MREAGCVSTCFVKRKTLTREHLPIPGRVRTAHLVWLQGLCRRKWKRKEEEEEEEEERDNSTTETRLRLGLGSVSTGVKSAVALNSGGLLQGRWNRPSVIKETSPKPGQIDLCPLAPLKFRLNAFRSTAATLYSDPSGNGWLKDVAFFSQVFRGWWHRTPEQAGGGQVAPRRPSASYPRCPRKEKQRRRG